MTEAHFPGKVLFALKWTTRIASISLIFCIGISSKEKYNLSLRFFSSVLNHVQIFLDLLWMALGICVPSLYYEFPNLYPCKLLFPYLFCINNFQATFKEDIYGFCFYKFAEHEIVYIILLILIVNILCHQVIQLVFIINFCVIVCSYCFKLYIFMIILYVSYRISKEKGWNLKDY